MSVSPQIPRRILIVEDEPSVCRSVRLIFRSQYETDVAGGSREALEILENKSYDLVILDFLLPGMRGDELSEIIKTLWPQTGIVMLTASAITLLATGVPLPFVDALVGKPFPISELTDAVEHVLALKQSKARVAA